MKRVVIVCFALSLLHCGEVINKLKEDQPGFSVKPAETLRTTEEGGQDNFTIALTAKPTANVTIELDTSDNNEGTVSPSSLTFTPFNYSAPQVVTVTGQNDLEVDGDTVYQVLIKEAYSTDQGYDRLDAEDVNVTNIDNESAGVLFSQTTGLVTTELGTQAVFTARLTSQPASTVTMSFTSSNVNEGTVSPASLVFTDTNWNSPRTVLITGVDDALVDGAQAYTIDVAPLVSTDTNYEDLLPAPVAVTNYDNESAGFVVSPTTGLFTSEAGGTASFEVSLIKAPSADVTINLSSSNIFEGTIGVGSLSFTPSNWDSPQTVTVTGVDDVNIADGGQLYQIITGAATSLDSTYAGVDPPDVYLTNSDNETAGVTITPLVGLTTTEAGGTAQFNVSLNAAPAVGEEVYLLMESTNDSEGTILGLDVLTFDSLDFAAPQTVTIKGLNDNDQDGDQPYDITFTPIAAVTDPAYINISIPNVLLTNIDDETPGIVLVNADSLSTTEGGGDATFRVRLATEPTSTVTLSISSTDTDEGTVSVATIPFSSADWNSLKDITVTGVNDDLSDGNQVFTVQINAAGSLAGEYASLPIKTVIVSNVDNDSAGITATPSSATITSEAGGQATFDVVLSSEPTANVVVPISSTRIAEGTVSPASLTFTPANWNSPQQVTVTGQDDNINDGNQLYRINVGPATSTDFGYSGYDPNDIDMSNTDNDTGGITVNPTSGLETTEGGGQTSFTIVLNSQPSSDVVIPLSSSDTNEGTVPAQVVFNPTNWNAPQVVMITGGPDNGVAEGDQAYTVEVGTPTSADGEYAALAPSFVSVTNKDDDSPDINISSAQLTSTEKPGGAATFNVSLNSEPLVDVIITIASADTSEGTIATGGTLTFTSLNWNSVQPVTVNGADDFVADGDQNYFVTISASAVGDANYNGMTHPNLTLTNIDDDSPGITVTPIAGLTTSENGDTATFQVKLNSMPSGDVTIDMGTSNNNEGTITAATGGDLNQLTFTTANWNSFQTITVTGVNDDIADGNQPYSINLGPVSGGDYTGVPVDSVSLINADNNSPGIKVTAVPLLTTREDGTTDSFTIELNSEPTGTVTINLSSSEATEGTIVPNGDITFDAGNWNTPRLVTITGQDDAVADGNQAYSIVIGAASGGGYDGIDPADISVINVDNDNAGVTINALTDYVTFENQTIATTARFEVVLNIPPASSTTVTIPVSVVGTEGSIVNPGTGNLVFDDSNWNIPQTVEVKGEDDTPSAQDGNQDYTVELGVITSGDSAYAGINPPDVQMVNVDDETPGFTVLSSDYLTGEALGSSGAFSVVLNAQPAAGQSVTIPITSSDTTEGEPVDISITFDEFNWNTAQSVTVNGLDDGLVDGDIPFSIILWPAISGDTNYSNLDPVNVSMLNVDDD